MANSRFRAILRHPQGALSLAGVGGMTVVDAAPWGRADPIYEAAPLVDGGWLSVDQVVEGVGHLVVSGEVRAIPGQPVPSSAGERRHVTWRLSADDPWLRFEGADGLWLHPSADLDLLDGWFWSDRVVLGHDGQLTEDLGGAVRIEGASGLLIATPEVALQHKTESTRRLTGLALDAIVLTLWSQGEAIGLAPVDTEGGFDLDIPSTVDAVQATATGRAPSDLVAVDNVSVLRVGAPASLDLRIAWEDATPRPVRMRWTATDGRAGETLLDPLGEVISLGEGVYEVALTAGPTVQSRQLRVELSADSEQRLGTTLNGIFAVPRHIYAALRWPGSRSRTVRDSPERRLRDAVGRGLSFVQLTAEDDVAGGAAYVSDGAWIRWDSGTTLTHPAGWQVSAWPYPDPARRNAHSAPPVRDLSPLDTLGLAWGGVNTDRNLAVSLSWLQSVDLPPWAFDPRPDHVVLPPPGFPPFRAWQTWFDWLDAGRFLLPSGPRHWLDVEDASFYGPVDIRRSLNRGNFSTGTGAWLDLKVDDVGPGEVLEPSATPDTDTSTHTPHHIRLQLRDSFTGLDHVGLLTSGGVLVDSWPVTEGELDIEATVELGAWVLALAWADNGADWVVTAATWTHPPAALPPTDTADTASKDTP